MLTGRKQTYIYVYTWDVIAYQEHNGWHGSVAGLVNHSKHFRHVAITSRHKNQSVDHTLQISGTVQCTYN